MSHVESSIGYPRAEDAPIDFSSLPDMGYSSSYAAWMGKLRAEALADAEKQALRRANNAALLSWLLVLARNAALRGEEVPRLPEPVAATIVRLLGETSAPQMPHASFMQAKKDRARKQQWEAFLQEVHEKIVPQLMAAAEMGKDSFEMYPRNIHHLTYLAKIPNWVEDVTIKAWLETHGYAVTVWNAGSGPQALFRLEW
eukprot:TRINITY_DN84965_c0_g1_i1.p1 TRINITY_DN84965_c0_g1~~TRINITY_DN84965_c0_g1_i1.p1  ORF type:complete len:199 (+),score=45.18 TRINITY_DN84965_c0_g1_i1:42-638(+)